jgi:hypothetical protein
MLDRKMNFIDHARSIYQKVSETIRRLGYILPNLGGARERRRRLLASVATSKMLYGAPCWEAKMAKAGWEKMEKLQRQISLRTAAAYRSVSYQAIATVASTPPFRLKAKERSSAFGHGPTRMLKIDTFRSWQEEWENSTKGRWTYTLIPKVINWANRSHGEINFHLTQFLTGHGSFGSYLHRIQKRDTSECQLCGIIPDTPKHAIFDCDAWYSIRNEIEAYTGVAINSENVIGTMLESKANWTRISSAIVKILRTREEVERAREIGADRGALGDGQQP